MLLAVFSASNTSVTFLASNPNPFNALTVFVVASPKLFISPARFAEIRGSQDFVEIANGQAILDGQVGMFMGCHVVVSNLNHIQPETYLVFYLFLQQYNIF